MKVKAIRPEVVVEGKVTQAEVKREMEVTPVYVTSLEEAVKVHGPEQVVKAVNAAIDTGVRVAVTSLLLKDATVEEVNTAVASYKLHNREKKDPMLKLIEAFNALPAEEKAKYMAQLRK